jgi:hypothetical protein
LVIDGMGRFLNGVKRQAPMMASGPPAVQY